MTSDLIYKTANELLGLFKRREASPVEVITAVLERVEERDKDINAFILVDEESALEQAKESEQRWNKGNPRGRLDGVPISIKDMVLTKGWPTLRGSLTVDPAGPWEEDAPSVGRLREHGAVIFGKTTMPEFGWKGVGDCELTGITRNPWNLDKTPGGSSGGASAALAARMGPLAIGGDGGGSIRIPSSFTGVFGIKANYGRVPSYPEGAMRNLTHTGPMTLTVEDAALLLTVISEPDHRDWTRLVYNNQDFTDGLDKGIAGLRIAYSPDLGYARVDSSVRKVVDAAAKVFEDLGAKVEEKDPGFANPLPIFLTHWGVGAAGALGSLPEVQKAKLEPALREFVEKGREISLGDYTSAMNQRTALCIHMRKFHREYDLLLTPTMAVPAFDVGHLWPPDRSDGWDWTPFSYPFNLTQQPACSVPCGFTETGLPVGLQIISDNFREDLVLRAAHSFEDAAKVNTLPSGF
jgi:aspartyl-tRNA(Asn)/glutamyl-tRNA(Gln) amidotransferase subunit A